MAKPKPLHQWDIPSDKDPDKSYKVSEYPDGVWKCSCPHWIFRCQKDGEDCKHITDVKNGNYDDNLVRQFFLRIENVQQVTLIDELSVVEIPMRPADDTQFLATIIYDCLQIGVPWRQIVDYERYVPREWNKAAVIAYIEDHGRKTYGPWVEKQGHVGFEYHPAKP